ncbi:hypothetical protein MG293_000997 [Ovis ammon polii]|uniref:Uncharacterized protein n=1 Tax=Ovis ammon polii TaxID=230172 RepID=A0AAD4YIF5_OVIAM|nr:hypothetical protein MG293_000997 [Ovis ammon polii]
MRREHREFFPDEVGKGFPLRSYEAETGLLLMLAGHSFFLSSGDRPPPLEMLPEHRESFADEAVTGTFILNYEVETGFLLMVAGQSVFLPSGDGHVGELLELQQGCKGPFRSSRGKMRRESRESFSEEAGKGTLILSYEEETGILLMLVGPSVFLSSGNGNPRSTSTLERKPEVLASAPDEDLGPGTDWRGILRGPCNLHGDWCFQRQYDRVSEFPIVTR